MRRVCFVSLTNMYLTPYLIKYTELGKYSYDIIYWNRHGIEEKSGAEQEYPFEYRVEENVSKKQKIIGYLKWKKYVQRILKKNDYSKVVLLQTSAGILLSEILKKKYKNRFIVDVRDYTMENNSLFKKIEKALFDKADAVVISSKGYENFLPTKKYVYVHNDINIDTSVMNDIRSKQKTNEKIVLSYIGLIRFHAQNKKIIERFGNDERFRIRFIGTGADYLREIIEDGKYNNIELIDRFPPEETMNYYKSTDMILNLYGNNTPLLDYALSNKLYYSAKLGIPILVCPDTYMSEIAMQYSFGCECDLDDRGCANAVFEYYRNFEKQELIDGANRFLDEVNEENRKFEDTMRMKLMEEER